MYIMMDMLDCKMNCFNGEQRLHEKPYALTSSKEEQCIRPLFGCAKTPFAEELDSLRREFYSLAVEGLSSNIFVSTGAMSVWHL